MTNEGELILDNEPSFELLKLARVFHLDLCAVKRRGETVEIERDVFYYHLFGFELVWANSGLNTETISQLIDFIELNSIYFNLYYDRNKVRSQQIRQAKAELDRAAKSLFDSSVTLLLPMIIDRAMNHLYADKQIDRLSDQERKFWYLVIAGSYF